MTDINVQCTSMCGPYQGYYGQAKYDDDSSLFHGEVLGTRDVITFQGRTVRDLRAAFKGSVDDYLDFCKSRGETPEKPFSGQFVARVRPDVHRRLSSLAQLRGQSLNRTVSECLEKMLDSLTAAPRLSETARGPLSGRKRARRAGSARKRRKHVA